MYSNKTRLKTIQDKKRELLNRMLKEVKMLQDAGVELDPGLLKLSEKAIEQMSPEELAMSYQQLKDEKSDVDFLERIQPILDTIPVTNGGRFYQPIDLKIGIIADEFLFYSYENAANMVYITRENYKEHEDIDVFIVASAWKGLDLSWRGLGNPNNTNLREELYEMISYYRAKDIKIVFYSKEDPTNYDAFVDIAKHCDYIFTTAKEKINDYKEYCNNDNVFALEFGFNPIYNNPVGMKQTEKLDGAIFAGSWYEKYPHRKKDTKMIFDGVIHANKELKIIDRNYHLNLNRHFFPREYIRHLSPSIEHQTLQKVFKLYNWVINLNSVQKSETMFANRVYELQAMGNLILSNYSLGINNLFPNIFIIDSSEEISDIMNNVTDKELYMHQMEGVRTVMRQHTTFHRLNDLLQKIGYEQSFIKDRKIAVVFEPGDDKAQENFQRQSYPHKTIVTAEYVADYYEEFDYITFFHPDYEYGEYYLEDLINGFKYTDSSYVTKDAYYNHGELQEGVEHDFVSTVNDKYKTVFDTTDFTLKELLELDGSLERGNGYSIDSLELDVNPVVEREDDAAYKLSVIIPVYNNGRHLYSKCFMSLKRSSIFHEMDIILVDDGSTDNETLKMVDRLERLYPNIQTYKFDDNGSGSASRPRNKGFELAKADLITYLDPDNEAVNDSYAHLLKEMEENPYLDLVVGDIIKYDTERKVMNYSKNAFKWDSSGIVSDTRAFLHDSMLRAQSIQALIVKKKIIADNNLQMVERAVGQDTLFFQQLILNCNTFKAVDRIIHIYYAAVTTSVTNSISKRFFEKYLILERKRYEFLEEEGLLDLYLTDRFNSYFVGWYLVRVPRLKEEEAEESLKILYQIYDIYRKKVIDKAPIIEMFEKSMRKGEYEEFINYCRVHFSKKRVKEKKSKVTA